MPSKLPKEPPKKEENDETFRLLREEIKHQGDAQEARRAVELAADTEIDD